VATKVTPLGIKDTAVRPVISCLLADPGYPKEGVELRIHGPLRFDCDPMHREEPGEGLGDHIIGNLSVGPLSAPKDVQRIKTLSPLDQVENTGLDGHGFYHQAPGTRHQELAWLSHQLLADIADTRLRRPHRKRQHPRIIKVKRKSHKQEFYDIEKELAME